VGGEGPRVSPEMALGGATPRRGKNEPL